MKFEHANTNSLTCTSHSHGLKRKKEKGNGRYNRYQSISAKPTNPTQWPPTPPPPPPPPPIYTCVSAAQRRLYYFNRTNSTTNSLSLPLPVPCQHKNLAFTPNINNLQHNSSSSSRTLLFSTLLYSILDHLTKYTLLSLSPSISKEFLGFISLSLSLRRRCGNFSVIFLRNHYYNEIKIKSN